MSSESLKLVREPISNGNGFRFTFIADSTLMFEQVLLHWRDDAAFREGFNATLAEIPFTAFRWETPCVTASTLTRPFEFVVLNSPSLSRPADPEAFAEHFRNRAEESVISFRNLGGDAILIVPCPTPTEQAYTHLADFVRHAPEGQRDAIWQKVGEVMLERVGKKPVWLSTAGAGVAWLHLRLDDRPKYYAFEEYRKAK